MLYPCGDDILLLFVRLSAKITLLRLLCWCNLSSVVDCWEFLNGWSANEHQINCTISAVIYQICLLFCSTIDDHAILCTDCSVFVILIWRKWNRWCLSQFQLFVRDDRGSAEQVAILRHQAAQLLAMKWQVPRETQRGIYSSCGPLRTRNYSPLRWSSPIKWTEFFTLGPLISLRFI